MILLQSIGLFLISCFLGVLFSFRFGYLIGAGSDGSGIILASISILNATIITCTFIIVDTLKRTKE